MWHEQRYVVVLQCLPRNLVTAAAATATGWLCYQCQKFHILTFLITSLP